MSLKYHMSGIIFYDDIMSYLNQIPFWLALLARRSLHLVTCQVRILRFQTWPSFHLKVIIMEHVYVTNISLWEELFDL